MTQPIERDPFYRGCRFQTETIELCVRWYITYRPSYRDFGRHDARARHHRVAHDAHALGPALRAGVRRSPGQLPSTAMRRVIGQFACYVKKTPSGSRYRIRREGGDRALLGSARGLRGPRPGVQRPGAQFVAHERNLRRSFIRGRLNASYPAVQRR
jgi:hypothetical protein